MISVTEQSWLARLGQYHPRLVEAALAMNDNDLPRAEPLLRAQLMEDPFDVAAIRLFAELAGRIGRNRDAEDLLRRALELSPAFTAARANLALVLYRQNRPAEALAELDRVIADEPDNTGYGNLKAASLSRLGEFGDALEMYRAVLQRAPNQPKVWMSFGHVLKTVGQVDEGIAAYRRSLELMPTLGETWWSLANLKTYRFTAKDIAAMEAALQSPDLADEDRFHLDFALGKAFEDAGRITESFGHYAAGNALRRTQIDYSADDTSASVDRSIALYSADFLAERGGQGCNAPDPIFVLGMPRSGSTLVEQILASHSQVEGTMELPDIPALALRHRPYPEGIAGLSGDDLRGLGEEFLRRTRVHRKTERPFYIDKLPNNWAHTPFIHLILPNARIIDTRRHPLGCGFSNFKQHFAKGQGFSYDLGDMGRYYADYVRLMAHVDRMLPGRVHRVVYERMIDDTEAEVRALLDYCGLPFEPECLAFHQTERAVRTPSSEQVRQPIYRGGTEAWQPFSEHLDPLRNALAAVLRSYPDAPPKW